jgi:hypothetical protein
MYVDISCKSVGSIKHVDIIYKYNEKDWATVDRWLKNWVSDNNGQYVCTDYECKLSKISKRLFPRVAAWPWSQVYAHHVIEVPDQSNMPKVVTSPSILDTCTTP